MPAKRKKAHSNITKAKYKPVASGTSSDGSDSEPMHNRWRRQKIYQDDDSSDEDIVLTDVNDESAFPEQSSTKRPGAFAIDDQTNNQASRPISRGRFMPTPDSMMSTPSPTSKTHDRDLPTSLLPGPQKNANRSPQSGTDRPSPTVSGYRASYKRTPMSTALRTESNHDMPLSATAGSSSASTPGTASPGIVIEHLSETQFSQTVLNIKTSNDNTEIAICMPLEDCSNLDQFFEFCIAEKELSPEIADRVDWIDATVEGTLKSFRLRKGNMSNWNRILPSIVQAWSSNMAIEKGQVDVNLRIHVG